MIRCFRSAFSEWLIDEPESRYMRRPRGDVRPDPNQQVPYAHNTNVWRTMDSCKIEPLDGALYRLAVLDPTLPQWMISKVREVMP